MARQWFAIASSVFVVALLSVHAVGQNQYYDPNMNDGSTGLRPGWSRDGNDPANNRNRYMIAPTPVLQAQYTESNGHSFLPNWFNWGGNNQQNQNSQNGQNGQNSQNGQGNQYNQGNSNQQNQQAQKNQQRPQGNGRGNGQFKPQQQQQQSNDQSQMPPDPAAMQDPSLPGLGGSPLPRKSTQQGGMQNKMQAQAAQSNSVPHTASREPLTSSSDTTTSNDSSSANSGSSSRTSPARHVNPRVSPDELRRDLSGTFSNANGANETTTKSTQTATSSSTHTAAVRAKTDGDGKSGEAAVISDAPAAHAVAAPPSLPPATIETKPALAHPVTPFNDSQKARSAYGTAGPVHMPFGGAAAAPSPTTTAPTARGKEAFGEALQVAGGGDPNVLASTQTPVLAADIRGPKQILVGRDSVYRVRLQNQSEVAAEGLVATVRIPAGADVTNTTATQGSIQPTQDGAAKGQLQWHIGRLDRHASETLEVHLTPRESRPLELGVSWTVAPVGSRAIVEVQEAKLQLEIAGPNEVLFDKPQLFKITLTNPGTGPAESVKLSLLPPGNGQDPVSSTIGDLAAGATQTVEVELTARDAGKLAVKAVASAEGGLNCDAAKDIFCRKPELEVDTRGPATKYAGTMATYYIRARNPGTAPAEDVTLRAALPEGAEFTSASEGQLYDASRREVAWHIGTLAPGDDSYMEVKCVLKSPGTNRVKIAAATAKNELTADKVAETNVVAIADLKLDVSDPSGPIAVGSPAVYEIHIRNRGASSAKEVNVIGLFSEGLEPEQAEGAMYTVTDGRVSFRSIDEIAAGREVVLRIRAHGTQPGTHVFRAEVLCRDLEIKLAAEETTRFYADDAPADTTASKQTAGRADAFNSSVK